MSQAGIHDVCSQLPGSWIAADWAVCRPNGPPAVRWWVWGRVQTQVSGTRGCSQDIEDLRYHRLTEAYSCESRQSSQFRPHVGILTVTHTGVLQGVRDVEDSPSSERGATPGSDNDWNSVCNGVRVDDEREHQSVREGTPGGESV